MLIEVLHISPVIINAFFSLSKTMDMLVRLPEETKLSMVRLMILHRPQVLYKIPFSVYSLDSVDDRSLIAGIVNHIRCFRQLFSSFPEKDMLICGISPAKGSACTVRFQNDLSCPDLHLLSVLFCSKVRF